jgi:predicted RNA binding protein YcfA (HicA-like mRNA interferase family)
MSQWSSTKANRVLAALVRIGWQIKRESGSHKILTRPDGADVVFGRQLSLLPGHSALLETVPGLSFVTFSPDSPPACETC